MTSLRFATRAKMFVSSAVHTLIISFCALSMGFQIRRAPVLHQSIIHKFHGNLRSLRPTSCRGEQCGSLLHAYTLSALSDLHLAQVDINQGLTALVDYVGQAGPYGYILFSAVYIAVEILAIPAVVLTASSGYLFGLWPGSLLVLFSATVAATISFLIGRTLLRGWAEKLFADNPKWKAVDKAVAKEGFKVVLLLRLSPLLPFALSNYLYAITSIDFPSFIAATVLGFAPGTFAFAYFGSAGKDLLVNHAASLTSLPWYAYASIGLLGVLAVQTITAVAKQALDNIEKEQAQSGDEI